jgi:hypothetical protein
MQRKRASVSLALVVTAALLACTALLLFSGSVPPAAASVLQQVGATPTIAQGTVTAAGLNVRAEPALTGRVVGTLGLGSLVNILGRRGSWYQIEDARGPGGKGWVSARFVQERGGNTRQVTAAEIDARASATASVGTSTVSGDDQVLAPVIITYQPPVLQWRWVGDTAALENKDWYFDVQVIQKFDAYPYWTQVVEPPGKSNGAQQQGDTYKTDLQSFHFRCGSSFAVQIAVRENGRFAGWLSPRSNLLPFTPVCQQNSRDEGLKNPFKDPGWATSPGPTPETPVP